ncbi:MAG: flavin reductase family protein [Pseudomonas sp.]
MDQIDPRALRQVLGCYATGVAVITTLTPDGADAAVTVNSFASVSLAPPLVLFSMALTSNITATFTGADVFTINVLSEAQQSVSNRFARPSLATWEDVQLSRGSNGCALLTGALAQIECRKYQTVDGGDHVILLGHVTAIHLGAATEALLFYRGAYGTYTRDQWSKRPPLDGSLGDIVALGWA